MATPIPDNACAFSVEEVARATGASVRPGTAPRFSGVTTDTRRDATGKLFVALRGDTFDGHRFIEQAVRAGAAGVLVEQSDVDVPDAIAVFRVHSSLDALGALGRAQRRRWGGKLATIVGSAGKTTTKTAVAAALEALAPGAVHRTSGNLNNRVGVPMTLFGLSPEHRYAVIEVGTNVTGEVAALASVCEADLGVLTLISFEHTEGLGDLDAIEREEGEALHALGPAGTAVANIDDERCARQLELCSAGVKLGYGHGAAARYRIASRRSLGGARAWLHVERPGGALGFETTLLGRAGALATAAALAAAEGLTGERLSAQAAASAFCATNLAEPGRLVPIELADGCLVLDDTYNANPASIESSVAFARELASERGSRLVLVIGEMRELGPFSERLHRELGEKLAQSRPAALIAVAGHAALFAEVARSHGVSAQYTADASTALASALELLEPGDVVLVKASRGVRAERVVEGLITAKGRAA